MSIHPHPMVPVNKVDKIDLIAPAEINLAFSFDVDRKLS